MHPSVDEGPRLLAREPRAVVVLLHGQPGTAGDWYRVTPLLSTDHRVIAVDRPGYAGVPTLARDWGGNAEALLALLDRLQIQRVVLVAASWAGGVAIEFAARWPGRLTGIVFVASVGGGGAITLLDRLAAIRPVLALGVFIAQHTGVSVAGPMSRAAGSHLDEEAVLEARLALAVWNARKVWTAAAIEQRYLIRDDELLLALVRNEAVRSVPAVVVQGTRDLTLPPKAGADLAAALPNAAFVQVDAGHMVAFEEPGTIAAAVRRLTS